MTIHGNNNDVNVNQAQNPQSSGDAGVYPYHCHRLPVEDHVSRGLYGIMIIDPETPRPQATEMVMMLNSYSYSFQGIKRIKKPPTLTWIRRKKEA